jgi:uncharacterized protein
MEQFQGVTKAILKQEKPTFSTANALPINRTRYPDNDEYLAQIVSAITKMDACCLCIQGPPGAGKTYTASHVIVALANAGMRIGVMSNSHAAILNLFHGLCDAKISTHVKVAKIGGSDNQTFNQQFQQSNFHYIHAMANFNNANTYTSFSILGGTAFAFAHKVAFEAPLDYLFVDEASQVALANLIAVLGATKKVVLMGDQMQLKQPTQGQHPKSGQISIGYVT